MGAIFVNTTNQTLNTLTISYLGEEWRQGTAGLPQVLNFSYELGTTSFEAGGATGVAGLGFSSPNNRDLTTQYAYNSAGLLSSKIDANGQVTRYLYDADGELRFTINALGEVTENAYDANGRVILDALRERARDGGAVVVVSHRADAVEMADDVYHMRLGRLEAEPVPAGGRA